MATLPRLTRAEAKAQTRRVLVDAAERLFTTNGFHGTSLDLVASEAGYTKGAVYSNFGSKEDLFFAVYERRVERAIHGFDAIVDSSDDEAPERSARATLAASEAGWIAVFLEFWAHVVRNPELRERFADLHARARAPLTEWGWRWLERNAIELHVGADAWVAAMFAMVTGVALEQLTDAGFDGAGVTAEIFELIMTGMRAKRGE